MSEAESKGAIPDQPTSQQPSRDANLLGQAGGRA